MARASTFDRSNFLVSQRAEKEKWNCCVRYKILSLCKEEEKSYFHALRKFTKVNLHIPCTYCGCPDHTLGGLQMMVSDVHISRVGGMVAIYMELLIMILSFPLLVVRVKILNFFYFYEG